MIDGLLTDAEETDNRTDSIESIDTSAWEETNGVFVDENDDVERVTSASESIEEIADAIDGSLAGFRLSVRDTAPPEARTDSV